MTFDEYTLISPINVTTVSITDPVTRDVLANLENVIVNTTTSGRVIELIITQEDINSINSIEGLSNIGLDIDNGFVVEILSQPSTTMTGIEVATLEPDLQPPSLLEFSFDLNSGIFTLTFTENISQTNSVSHRYLYKALQIQLVIPTCFKMVMFQLLAMF